MGDDAGAIPLPRAAPARDSTIEDQLDLLGAAEIEVLTDHLFKKHAAMHGTIKHLCGRELRLQDRDVIAIAGFAVGRGERMRRSRRRLFCRCSSRAVSFLASGLPPPRHTPTLPTLAR